MLTRKTHVLDLANNNERTFFNALSAIENLITAYMIDTGMASQIHNQRMRDRCRSKVLRGKISASLGDLAVKIQGENNKSGKE